MPEPIINPAMLDVPGIDMSVYSPAVIFTNAVKSFRDSIPTLNEMLVKGYLVAVDNWRLNRDAGHPIAIPTPPPAYELVVDSGAMTLAVVRGAPACPQWIEPAPVEPPSVAGVLMPPFAAGRYLTILGDNAPAGHRLTTPDGTLVEKVVTGWAGFKSVEYRKVA